LAIALSFAATLPYCDAATQWLLKSYITTTSPPLSMQLLDIRYQLAFYKAYHLNPRNVAIHLCCIPLILLSAMCLLANVLPGGYGHGAVTCLAVIYGIYYVLLHPAAGVLASGFLWIFWRIAVSGAVSTRTALIVHVAGWVAQFIGHGVWEHRAPAVLDNPVQPLVLAPYLVLFELLFALGWCKQLKHDMMIQAGELRKCHK
jgi:uncharacterized membrane protein YGL010W